MKWQRSCAYHNVVASIAGHSASLRAQDPGGQARRAEGGASDSLLSEVSEDTLSLLWQQAIDAGQTERDLNALQARVVMMRSFKADDLSRLAGGA